VLDRSARERGPCGAFAEIREYGAEEQEAADPGTIGPWYLSAGLGGYWPTSSDQLKNQSGQYSIMIGGGYRVSKYLSIDVDVWGGEQRVDVPATVAPPLLGTADSRSTINTSANTNANAGASLPTVAGVQTGRDTSAASDRRPETAAI